MKVNDQTIKAMRTIINGDAEFDTPPKSPYRTAFEIENFFKEFAISPESGSRWYLTESCLQKLNNTDLLERAIEKALHPSNFFEREEYSLDESIKHLNNYLEFDGYKIVYTGKLPRVISIGSDIELELNNLPDSIDGSLKQWIDAHNKKSQQKIADKDYEGAITNARSMVEQLYIWILKNTTGGYDRKLEGDLVKLGNAASKRFGMDPTLYDTPLKQLISGMNSQIAGLAGLRNKASDAHGTEYKPGLRHAKLAVNTAVTVVNYFADLCHDQNVLDKELKEKEDEELAEYHAAMAESMNQ